ncbi:hypothetical protein pEaSNUABM56_00062 [Erwinia phage pEa_SNUABM_56]|uniref:Putative anti-restriction nuclease n=1 Tax=Erwinia phage pEp_SNUABM_01 TaxID=2601643 RepID=A0A5J6DAF8_9CAUD|nr:putative anti-restriction nuclease [Erwinia phage pEp_SNUABM_01]QEQ94862.1 putative anti-restriction nuclease [Erwinia phage pEp_SNUABM_01]UYL85107.1 hypothetical protein pEaSNUABM56_00062 [Erwinia phage pEa_SNUABM_56]
MFKDYPAQPGVSLDTIPAICVKTWDNIRVQRKIVCAANVFRLINDEKIVIPASRHYSKIMGGLAKMLKEKGIIQTNIVAGDNQGFIDQFDDYHTREDAFIIAQHSGQPFDAERNGHNRELFSEGLY